LKTILVTGGSQGIGRGIIENLPKNQYNIILNYNKSEESANNIKENLLKKGYNIEIFKADVSKKEETIELVNFAIEKYGGVDVLINNAGISKFKMFCDITEQDWEELVNTNLKSALYMIQNVLPYMVKRKEGCIINISSIWGMVGASCESLYAITKAGMDAMTKSLAKELGPSNIRVNSIAPGMIETKMNSIFDEETKKQIIEEIPLGRIGKTEDIAKCVNWLIEDEYTTGQIISPNGGFVI